MRNVLLKAWVARIATPTLFRAPIWSLLQSCNRRRWQRKFWADVLPISFYFCLSTFPPLLQLLKQKCTSHRSQFFQLLIQRRSKGEGFKHPTLGIMCHSPTDWLKHINLSVCLSVCPVYILYWGRVWVLTTENADKRVLNGLLDSVLWRLWGPITLFPQHPTPCRGAACGILWVLGTGGTESANDVTEPRPPQWRDLA